MQDSEDQKKGEACDCGHNEDEHAILGETPCRICSCARYQPPDPEYPEHRRLLAVHDESQAIGSFLDWMESGPLGDQYGPTCLAYRMLMTEYSRDWDMPYEGPKDRRTERMYPLMRPKDELLALFFEIDLAKIETEKRTMLEAIRAQEAPEAGDPPVS